MEFDSEQTIAYLGGKVDEYVKYQGRQTVAMNAESDPDARYARIPDGNACEFCRMLGSRGFVYHSEELAGGTAHGTKWDTYHPFCNCQIAVSFDYVQDEYWKNGVKVRRGYALDGEVTVPGRDGSDRKRIVDIDKLYDEYLAAGKDYTASAKRRSARNDGRNLMGGTKLPPDEFQAAMQRLADTRTLDELHAVGKDIVDRWPRNEFGRNAEQWHEMSELAQRLDREMRSDDERTVPLRMTGKETYSHYGTEEERLRDWSGFGTLAPINSHEDGINAKAAANAQSKSDLPYVKQGLSIAIDNGYIKYKKPLSAFEESDDERRDLFAHAVLVRNGFTIETIPESKEHKNIDLMIAGKYWEVKSPDADGKSKDPTKFVQNNFESAYDQFKGHPNTDKMQTRIVYNCRYTEVDEGLIIERIEREMSKRPGIVEVLMITRDGRLMSFPRS